MKPARILPWLRFAPIAVLALTAIYVELTYDESAGFTEYEQFLPPSGEHLLGTDHLGRDLLYRLVLGTRTFFFPGLLAAAITMILGTALGSVAGYVGLSGGIDSTRGWKLYSQRVLRGAVNVMLAVPAALPRFVSILLVCAALGFERMLLAAVIGVLYAAELGTDLRRRVSLCCGEEYVEAAQAEGLSTSRILGYHILFLHCRTLIVRHLIYVWSFCILAETSMSAIEGGFGFDESWGTQLEGGLNNLHGGHLLGAILPTIAIVATVVFLARVGDRLSDADARDEEVAT